MPKKKYKKRADGRKESTITISGKRYHVYGYTDAEIEEQKKALIRADENRSLYIDQDTAFPEYAERWLGLVRPNLGIRTVEMYEDAVRKLNALIGDKTLSRLTRDDLQIALNAQADHPRTQEILYITLKQIFDSAVDNELIYKNPSKGLSRVSYKAQEKRALTDAEVAAVRSGCLDPEEQLYVDILYYCGLRREEALALSIYDINRRKWTMQIHNVLVLKSDDTSELKECPKTPAGDRVLPIPLPLQASLGKHLDSLGGTSYLFTRRKAPGCLHTKSSYRRMWERILLKLNAAAGGVNQYNKVTCRTEIIINMVPGLTAHVFRHNYATMLYKKGVPVKQAQILLGHSNVMTTLAIYTHLDKDSVNHDLVNSVFSDDVLTTSGVKTGV